MRSVFTDLSLKWAHHACKPSPLNVFLHLCSSNGRCNHINHMKGKCRGFSLSQCNSLWIKLIYWLSHRSPVTLYDDIDLGKHWLRQRFSAANAFHHVIGQILAILLRPEICIVCAPTAQFTEHIHQCLALSHYLNLCWTSFRRTQTSVNLNRNEIFFIQCYTFHYVIA